MFSARIPTRVATSARAARIPRTRPQRRYQSTTSGASSSSHLASGAAGGVAGAAVLYGIYLMTPSGKMTRKINAAAREADQKYQQVAATIRDKTPTTDEAVDRLKQFCYSYVAWVPGGRQYVDSAFDDLAAIRAEHGDEVDRIVRETYREFQEIAKTGGLSLESASRTYDALAKLARKVAGLGVSAADQILDRHPQLDDKVGEPIRQLKQMGSQYGPEAKKMVDETWSQISDVLAGGVSADSADKVRKIVEERTEQLRRVGDDVWEKGLEQARPYLDKNPQLRDLVLGNRDVLRQGNVGALVQQLRSLGEGGDMKKVEEYVRQAVDKAKSAGSKAASGSGSGTFAALQQFLGSSSSGDMGRKVQDNIGLLTKVVNEHSDEGRELLEETKGDLIKLLEGKAAKAQKIVEKAKKE